MVKFCPLCGSGAVAYVSIYSKCSECGLMFSVHQSTNSAPTLGSKTYKEECGNLTGRGKVCHTSVAEAYARSLHLEDIPHRFRDQLGFYQCRWCSKIHAGHGGKHRKNVSVSYTNEQARVLYEEAIQRGDILPYE